LYPDKRKDFGSLWLANKYYPDRFQDDRGAPAFGLGVLYADFGLFAIVYYVVGELLTGFVLGILAATLRHSPDAGYFFLFAIFMDVPLMPTGTGFPLVIYYVLAHLMRVLGNDSARRQYLPENPVVAGQPQDHAIAHRPLSKPS
jgi:hypothetical protein